MPAVLLIITTTTREACVIACMVRLDIEPHENLVSTYDWNSLAKRSSSQPIAMFHDEKNRYSKWARYGSFSVSVSVFAPSEMVHPSLFCVAILQLGLDATCFL